MSIALNHMVLPWNGTNFGVVKMLYIYTLFSPSFCCIIATFDIVHIYHYIVFPPGTINYMVVWAILISESMLVMSISSPYEIMQTERCEHYFFDSD